MNKHLYRVIPKIAKNFLSSSKNPIPIHIQQIRSIVSSKQSSEKWSIEREPHDLPPITDIIHDELIHQMMEETVSISKDKNHISSILEKAKNSALLKDINEIPGTEYVQGLTLEETATLLNCDENDEELMGELFDTALFIKRLIYGNRIVLFAPLYVSNLCIGSCLYCGYRGKNHDLHRKILSIEELISEVESLERVGHKRLLMLCGEHPEFTFDDFLEYLEIAASVKTLPHGEIRRINVEIPQISTSDFRRLKATGCVGTYINFQETYHKPTYEKMHPKPGGMKCDYDDRLLSMDRSLIAGLDDVGIGALYGLYDYRYEVLSVLEHANHLDKTYGAGPHTISVPRIRHASGSALSEKPPYGVTDNQFKKLVAVIRCAVPYTGMILTTREGGDMRDHLLNVGVSQMSAGSKTDIGSYSEGEEVHKEEDGGQFQLEDHRPTEIVIRDLLENGFIPSWCTACYRKGRTGPIFMGIAKKGEIHNMCHPNALLTLQEYLLDYADETTQQIGFDLLNKEIHNVTDQKRRSALIKALEMQKKGKRDLHF